MRSISDEPPQAPNLPTPMQNHPLTEISSSPGHPLLLKLFHREEDLSALRVAALQTRLDTAKRDAFHLSTLFLAFHGLSLTLLFTVSINIGDKPCRNWGVPSFLILLTSLLLVCVVQVMVTGYWRAVQKMVKVTDHLILVYYITGHGFGHATHIVECPCKNQKKTRSRWPN